MIKAPASKTCTESWVAVVITNSFPSEGNMQMGRFLDTDAAKLNKSWMRDDSRKPLSKMHRRMLIGYGVKKSVADAYARSATNDLKFLKHAHLMGCIDPTGALPEKKVIISGYITGSDNSRALFGKVHTKVYLSRSPSLEPTDAKLVSVIGSKPREMSKDDWDMLCTYKFGTIIIPRSKEGSVPLPCVIADGDLDGDPYFVMWDKKIMEHLYHSNDKLTLKARRELLKLEMPADTQPSVVKKTKFTNDVDSNWLSKAQGKILNFPRQRAIAQLVGKLWGLCLKSSERPCGIDLFDKDAIAYAKAYKNALDVQKHGGTVYLPGRLHEKLHKFWPLLSGGGDLDDLSMAHVGQHPATVQKGTHKTNGKCSGLTSGKKSKWITKAGTSAPKTHMRSTVLLESSKSVSGLPVGWTSKTLKRSIGTTHATDKYFFSPNDNIKFRMIKSCNNSLR